MDVDRVDRTAMPVACNGTGVSEAGVGECRQFQYVVLIFRAIAVLLVFSSSFAAFWRRFAALVVYSSKISAEYGVSVGQFQLYFRNVGIQSVSA